VKLACTNELIAKIIPNVTHRSRVMPMELMKVAALLAMTKMMRTRMTVGFMIAYFKFT
jgi:hypothetical protein